MGKEQFTKQIIDTKPSNRLASGNDNLFLEERTGELSGTTLGISFVVKGHVNTLRISIAQSVLLVTCSFLPVQIMRQVL